MKKVMQLCLIWMSMLMLSSAYAANTHLSPIGYWKTIDDETGKVKSILHIYQSRKLLYGKVAKIYPDPGHTENEVCKACEGPRHNQPILGMIIMQGLTQNAKNPVEWSGGEILDPSSGKIYRCSLTVVNNGEKLNARGYLGISLFGRTQAWVRVSEPTT